MDYEQDILIDDQALDVEWLDQAARVVRYCTHAAEAHRDMDLAKENVDFIRAQLDQLIRAAPQEYDVVAGSRGVTEEAIKSAILMQSSYQKAVQEYLQKKYEFDVAQGAVRAFDHRKSALENLVRLHGQSYFAGPAVPHDLGELRQRRDEVRRERDAQAQRRVRIQRRAP